MILWCVAATANLLVGTKQRSRSQIQACHKPHSNAHPGQQRILVLDAVRLINDDVPPVEALEVVLLLVHHLVGGDHDIKFAGLDMVILAVLLRSDKKTGVKLDRLYQRRT
jgi:hypothetical protein